MHRLYSIYFVIISAFIFTCRAQNAPASGPEDSLDCQQECVFYQKSLEKSIPCGSEGYALAYGEKYCKRFEDHESTLSSVGKTWSQNTRKCLIDHLRPFATTPNPTSCQVIHDTAFESHSRCYTEPAHSICDLPASDIEKILGQMDLNDLTTKDGQKQIKKVVTTCVARLEKKLEAPIEHGLNPERETSQPSSQNQGTHSSLTTWKSFADKISYLEWWYGKNE